MKRKIAGAFNRLLFGDEPRPDTMLHATLRQPHVSVAFDTTKLQSAESFLKPTDNGRSDLRGDGEFKQVADAFCGGAALLVPLPFEEQGVSPAILDAWPGAARVPNLEFDPASDEQAHDVLIAAFIKAISQPRMAQDAAAWVSFQFTPEMGKQYESRGADEPIQRVANVAADLLDNEEVAAFEYELQRLESAGALTLPDAFWSRFENYGVRDAVHLAVSYALSIFLRGWSYATPFEISGKHPALYNPSWLRSTALKTRLRSEKKRVTAHEHAFFPWGTLLLGALQGPKPAMLRDLSAVIDIMLAIRVEGPAFLSDLSMLPGAQLTSAERSSSLSEGELELLRFLGRHGVFPQFKSMSTTKLLQAGGKLPKPYGDVVPGAEIVTLVLESDVGRGTAAALERTFKRDTFWDNFELPAVRDSLRLWRREQSRRNVVLATAPTSSSG